MLLDKYSHSLEQLFSSNSRPLVELITANPLAVCITDADGVFTFANRAYCRLYGYEIEELIGRKFTLVVPDTMREAAIEMHRNFIASGSDNLGAGDVIDEWTVIDKRGNLKVVVAEAMRIEDEKGNAYKTTFVVDVTNRKAMEAGLLNANTKLAYAADHDMLMSVLNRRAGLKKMENEILKATRLKRNLSIALIDLDHFKAVNDTYGHLVGDQVLSFVASLLSDNLRKQDTLVRYGGEELLMIMPGNDAHEALSAVERLSKLVAETPISDRGIHITFSGGVAESVEGISSTQLLERADIALYKAKEKRNTISLWSGLSYPSGI